MVSKSYVPFTCKFPMIMHFVPILHMRSRSKINFYVFNYDKTSLKFCASFRFVLAVFMKKFQKIHYLGYVRRGIISFIQLFKLLNYFVWLRITNEGSVPEMRIWSILLIKTALKWYIQLGRSLFGQTYSVLRQLPV